MLRGLIFSTGAENGGRERRRWRCASPTSCQLLPRRSFQEAPCLELLREPEGTHNILSSQVKKKQTRKTKCFLFCFFLLFVCSSVERCLTRERDTWKICHRPDQQGPHFSQPQGGESFWSRSRGRTPKSGGNQKSTWWSWICFDDSPE